jgi:hypothetical protein
MAAAVQEHAQRIIVSALRHLVLNVGADSTCRSGRGTPVFTEERRL